MSTAMWLLNLLKRFGRDRIAVPHRTVRALNLAGAKISAAPSPRPPRTWSHLHH